MCRGNNRQRQCATCASFGAVVMVSRGREGRRDRRHVLQQALPQGENRRLQSRPGHRNEHSTSHRCRGRCWSCPGQAEGCKRQAHPANSRASCGHRWRRPWASASSLMTTARADAEIRLAQLGEEKLLTFMGSMAAASLFRTDSADAFEKSVSGAQSLKFMEYANVDPAKGFVMNESYLKAQVKAGIIGRLQAFRLCRRLQRGEGRKGL
ncbi:hypothetical protein L1887_47354 [Cichorium endivia]|nr:hypothetical protein L1887_47354 [Cichorium endivia]